VYLTQAWLNEVLGSEKVSKLAGLTGQSIARTIDLAEAEVETVLMHAGYHDAVPSSNYTALPAAGVQPAAGECPRVISLLAYAAWIELVHGGHTLELPEQFAAYVKKLDDVRNGKIELPGLAKKGVNKDTSRARGGMSFTESSTDVTVDDGSRPSVFNRKSMQGY